MAAAVAKLPVGESFIAPVTILGPLFPETENYAVELASSVESYNEYEDDAAAAVALDAAVGIEAAARKFFLYVLGIAIITAPLIYYALPKKMAWLKYVLLGVIGLVAVTAAYVWYVAYTELSVIADTAEAVAANMAAIAEEEAAALDVAADEGELI